MEELEVKIKVFRNTENEKKILLNTVQNFIQSNNSGHEISVVQSIGRDGGPILEEFFSNLGFNMDCDRSAEENLSREDFLERANTKPAIMPELTFRLYNCDKTYDLDKVEALIIKVTEKMDQRANVEKTYFPLPEMKNLCRKLENEGRQRGYAVFVVHANEPGLVINSRSSSIAGYSMLYRTLVRITGDRVLIVIGGDEGYKDQEERDRSVLSRRVLNRVCSQFNKKYLNGEKGFVFSWHENHHPIHQEALEFYLNPQKQGQEFVPLPKTELPSFPLAKDECHEQKCPSTIEEEHQVLEADEATQEEVQAAAKSSLFHVLSFYSKKASVSTVEELHASVAKKLNVASQSQPVSPCLHPDDFPHHIKENKPEYVVLVTEMNDFKNLRYLENWTHLYQDILRSIAAIEKSLIFVVCGDPASKSSCLASDLVQEQFSSINSAILPPTKVTVMSWDVKPLTLHLDALAQLLDPSKSPEKRQSDPRKEQAGSWPEDVEIDVEKRRLRYRARIRRGQVVKVLKSHPPQWKPEETMLKQQLDRNKQVRGYLEFWENGKGNITAVVQTDNPAMNMIGMYADVLGLNRSQQSS